jgi:flavin-binding protein dodecin
MKKSRLLEIIREEISSALNELTVVDKKTLPTEAPEIAKSENTDINTVKNAIAQAKKSGKPVNVAEAEELEEDTLNERPFIDSAFDITGTSPENLNQDSLQNAIDDAVKVLQQENPDADVKKLAGELQKVNSVKNLGPNSKLSSELKSALQKVADIIEKQGQIFGSPAKINDLMKLAKDPSQIDRLEKLKNKGYTFILGNAQAVTAIEKSLGLKPKNNDSLLADKSKAEKPTKEKSPKVKTEKSPKAKVATRTAGDDGFDDVSYSDVDDEDKEATQNIGKDKTAKDLGNLATGKEETFNRILGLVTKYKDDKAKVDAFISKAENEYKLPVSLLNQLKLAAGRDVKI